MRIKAGQPAVDFEVRDINGNLRSLHALQGKQILLSFFRDAACPFCNLRIYELTKAYANLERHGLVMLGFFQSSADEIRKYVGKHPRPFPLIPDPYNTVYERYAVESSVTGLMRAMVRRMPQLLRAMFGHGLYPRSFNTTLPADFLIGPDLTVQFARYGKDSGDHIPVGQIEAFLQRAPARVGMPLS